MNGDKVIIFAFETSEKRTANCESSSPIVQNCHYRVPIIIEICSDNFLYVSEDDPEKQSRNAEERGEQVRWRRQPFSASPFTTFSIEFVIRKSSWAIFSCFFSPPSAAHRRQGTWTAFRVEVHIVTLHIYMFPMDLRKILCSRKVCQQLTSPPLVFGKQLKLFALHFPFPIWERSPTFVPFTICMLRQ